jgi:hypothetical protein
MGYRQSARGPRDSGRGRGIPRHEKAKKKKRKNQTGGAYETESAQVAAETSQKIFEKTVYSLRNLGRQVFALSPFSDHFDRWLTDVRMVLFEFESSSSVNVDDHFVGERSGILSKVESELAEWRHMESFAEEAVRQLSESRKFLRQIEEEYANEAKKVEDWKSAEIKHLTNNVDGLREELEAISRMKTGIFRGLSKETKAQKEADATKRLNQAESELASVEQSLTRQREELNEEYEKKKQPVASQVEKQQKEVDRIKVDGSLESRMAACEALVDALTRLMDRTGPQPNTKLK